MVGGPSLGTLSVPPDPATQQLTVVCVSISPSRVPVKVPPGITAFQGVITAAYWIVGVNAFHTQIHSLQPRYPWHIKPSVPVGAIPVSDRRILVFGEAVAVKSKPVAHFG